MTPERAADAGIQIRAALAALAAKYGPVPFLVEVAAFLREHRGWTPACGKEYSYTYEHVVSVEACPISEEQEADIETDAQALAEAKVARYCRRRTDTCKGIEIIESSPTGGGCTTMSFPVLGSKSVYVCRWTVKYKCVEEAH